MEEIYNWIAQNMSYGVITLFMAIESSFIPFPSEIIIIPAAYIAYHQGILSLPLIILFGTIGALIGALVNYGLSVWLGRPIIHRFADTKIAHMLLIDLPGVEKAEKYFADHGAVGTLIGRLIPAIRQLISIPAGLAKMNLSKFIFFTFLGAGLWNSVLAGLGAFFGHTLPEAQLIEKVQHYSHYVKLGIAAIIFVALVYYIYLVIKANRETSQRQ
jgi:membrane protein DedA with SNARE-associated domain